MQAVGAVPPWRARLTESLLDFARWTHGELVDADGVGVTVMMTGELVFAASTSFGDSLDALQYALGEGPCLTAVERGAAVRSAAIGSDETRWARFTPQAAQLGLRGVVSFPLRSNGTSRQVVGSLNLYGRTSRGILETDGTVMERAVAALVSPVNSARALAVADANTAVLIAAARRRRLSQQSTPRVMEDPRG